jgi:VanZ family protein
LFFKHNARIILTLMIALLLLFIWSNSLADSERSNALSGWVERWLKPLIDPQENIPDKTFDYDVRKFAHLFEYALLGALLVFGTARMNNRSGWMLLLVVLLAAVIDETIQFYTGRTSQLQDVWIDVFGAGIGMLLVYGVGRLTRKRKSTQVVPKQVKSETDEINKSRKGWIVVACLLIAVTLGFIWENSIKSRSESQLLSLSVLQWIRPFLGAIFSPENVTDHLLRKLAHFAEFGLLGAELIWLTHLLRKLRLQTVLICLFAGLSAAAMDETIQIFSARGSQAIDVLLDFGGVIMGTSVTLLVIAIITKTRKLRAKA